MAIHHQTTQLRILLLKAANMPVFRTQKAVKSFPMPQNSKSNSITGPSFVLALGSGPVAHALLARKSLRNRHSVAESEG